MIYIESREADRRGGGVEVENYFSFYEAVVAYPFCGVRRAKRSITRS